MITINRIRLRARRAMQQWQTRRLFARANRLLARSSRTANPGHDELSSPLFLGVMALAALVLALDVLDAWQPLGAFILALGSFIQSGA